jgi:hypothetical protein
MNRQARMLHRARRMTRRSWQEMVADPRFILGIHNYCDRWCERCTLSSRCTVFARSSEKPEGSTVDEALESVKEAFAETIAMLQQKADELGIDLDGEPQPDDLARKRAVGQALDAHPLRRAAVEYARAASAWLAKHAGPGPSHDRPEPAHAQPVREGAPLLRRDEAIAIIGRYHFQIATKLMRALSFEAVLADESDAVQTDANGSARVALLGIERSVEAWFELVHCARGTEEILRIIDALNALRADVEQVFPDARRFVRPGFDTGDVAWPER